MRLEQRIRAAEQRVAATYGLTLTEPTLPQRNPAVRVLTTGEGEPLVHMNGISAPAMGMAPLIAGLPGFRHILIDLPARIALTEAIGANAARAMSADMLDLHRLPLRLPGQAASYRALLRRLIDGATARRENVLTDDELARIDSAPLFVWGEDDVMCSPDQARPCVAKIPGARLVTVAGGHAPWFDDAPRCAALVRDYLVADPARTMTEEGTNRPRTA